MPGSNMCLFLTCCFSEFNFKPPSKKDLAEQVKITALAKNGNSGVLIAPYSLFLHDHFIFRKSSEKRNDSRIQGKLRASL